jgi:hypothetical protein
MFEAHPVGCESGYCGCAPVGHWLHWCCPIGTGRPTGIEMWMSTVTGIGIEIGTGTASPVGVGDVRRWAARARRGLLSGQRRVGGWAAQWDRRMRMYREIFVHCRVRVYDYEYD